jgi:fucose 4-O-acetylase-like acetyltransferase
VPSEQLNIFVVISVKFTLDKGHYISAFGIFGGLFTIGKGLLWADICKNLAGCAMEMIFLCACWKIDCGGKTMQWLGKRSLYVYLVHLGVLGTLPAWSVWKNGSATVKVYLILAFTLILSEILYRLFSLKKSGNKQ